MESRRLIWGKVFPDGAPLKDLDYPVLARMEIAGGNIRNIAVNAAFLDWSIRRVGLKELWTLKWHRNFKTNGVWTKQGGVLPEDWPQWMRGFKDY